MNFNHSIHHANQSYMDHLAGLLPQLLLALPFIVALLLYSIAVISSNRKYKRWPLYRTVCWLFGVLFAVIAVAGPLANQSYIDFRAHMLGHLLLGMVAPLLMALAAPVTLALRSLSISSARLLSSFLKSWPSIVYTNPVFTTFLNVGGLWLLYTSDLYVMMHKSILLHVIIHIHVFFAGYLFTVSMIYIDPSAHRLPFLYRSVILIIALAGHGILAKYIYAHPPNGVPASQAEAGAMIMYYGGDVIDLILIFFLCFRWYKATRPRIIVRTGSSYP